MLFFLLKISLPQSMINQMVERMAALSNVPSHLTICVLYADDEVVVIDKPCDLRSVPGHAHNSPPTRSSNMPTPKKLSPQDAWVKAIRLLGTAKDTKDDIPIEDRVVKEIIRNLDTTTANTSGVPRKLETFTKYCHRNSKRLLPSFPDFHTWGSKGAGDTLSSLAKDKDCDPPMQKKQKREISSANVKREIPPKLRSIAQLAFAKIQEKQRPLLNLPKPTEDWESATGQLFLLGYGEYSHWVSSDSVKDDQQLTISNNRLYVVHRLDCQVSNPNQQ